MIVTSPPYMSLRAYKTDPVIWGGDDLYVCDRCVQTYAYEERGSGRQTLRVLRQGKSLEGKSDSEGMLKEVRGPIGDQGGEVAPAESPEQLGITKHQLEGRSRDPTWLRGIDGATGNSWGEQPQSDLRAPHGDAADDRAGVGPEGGGPPQERDQDGQPTREPHDRDIRESPRGSRLPALQSDVRGALVCPECGLALRPVQHTHVWLDEIVGFPYAGGNRGVPEEWQRNGRRESAFVEENWKETGLDGGIPEGQAGPRVMRSYGAFCACGAWRGELGAEPMPEMYVEHLVMVFREIRRVLRKDGVCFLNIGDSFWGSGTGHKPEQFPPGSRSAELYGRLFDGNGQGYGTVERKDHPYLKPKDLILIPFHVAIELQKDGWWVRSDVIWEKPNAMPSPVDDRPTKSHEFVFLLTRSRSYFYDNDGFRTPLVRLWDENNGGSISTGRQVEAHGSMGGMDSHPKGYPMPNPNGANLRDVWSIPTRGYAGSHFATFPEELPRRAILLGTSEKGCCSKCGKPWVRKVEREVRDPKPTAPDSERLESTGGHSRDRNISDFFDQALSTTRKTTGWEAACECGAEVIPCIVLDPFAGSGTALRVARSLGRRSVGIELNPSYVEQAVERSSALIPDITSFEEPKPEAPEPEMHLTHRRSLEDYA
jgi:DNA modification methylase